MNFLTLISAAALFYSAQQAEQSGAPKISADKQEVKQRVEAIGTAIVQGDFAKVVDSTYPAVVEMIGGRQKMLDLLSNGMKRLNDSGKSFVSIRIGEPSELVQGGSGLFTIVPTTLEMKVPEGKLIQKAFTLGISLDSGKTWSFVDGNGITPEQVKQMFPMFPLSLQLPPQERPVIVKDPAHH